jgi:RNA polymerase sigma-70 factor (ECF subfamily)
MAEIATGNPDDALDLVQDAMIKLVDKYADRDAEQWGALFHRILQRRIVDWHRRRTIRERWLGVFRAADSGDTDHDVVAQYPDIDGRQPDKTVANERLIDTLKTTLRSLPLRQQQVFLLRMLEGLDTRETAAAMGCSPGSVKTHYSRALHVIRNRLGDGML